MPVKSAPPIQKNLPRTLEGLVSLLPPVAIRDDGHHAETVKMIDRLMQIDPLSNDQAHYLETLLQLVEAYESRRHAIELSKLTGPRMLKHVLDQSGKSASDLARLLHIHASMGSKILKGERQLTWDHAKVLAAHFKVAPALFMS